MFSDPHSCPKSRKIAIASGNADDPQFNVAFAVFGNRQREQKIVRLGALGTEMLDLVAGDEGVADVEAFRCACGPVVARVDADRHPLAQLLHDPRGDDARDARMPVREVDDLRRRVRDMIAVAQMPSQPHPKPHFVPKLQPSFLARNETFSDFVPKRYCILRNYMR